MMRETMGETGKVALGKFAEKRPVVFGSGYANGELARQGAAGRDRGRPGAARCAGAWLRWASESKTRRFDFLSIF
jgi:hypothetical protein